MEVHGGFRVQGVRLQGWQGLGFGVLGFILLGLVGLLWFRLRARLWDCKVWSLEPFGIRPSSFGILYQQLGVS